MAFCNTFCFVSLPCWIASILSSRAFVISGETTVGQYFERTSMTSKPRSLIDKLVVPHRYLRSKSVWMVDARVALVPISSFSIFKSRLRRL